MRLEKGHLIIFSAESGEKYLFQFAQVDLSLGFSLDEIGLGCRLSLHLYFGLLLIKEFEFSRKVAPVLIHSKEKEKVKAL